MDVRAAPRVPAADEIKAIARREADCVPPPKKDPIADAVTGAPAGP
jgi:hypothetical protein